MSLRPPTLSVVIPLCNEGAGVDALFVRLLPILESAADEFEIVCVNDGSSDDTLDRLLDWQRRVPELYVLDLSRNFGKEAALTAGLDHARGRAVVPLDADLQDPPELIPQLLAKWREGFEMVLCRRTDRSRDGFVKRVTARLFYRLHNVISPVPIPENVGDFRLMDRAVVEAVKRLPERQRFMKGLFAWAGFRQTEIGYAREARRQGASKWAWWRLWNLGIDGLTSFSTAPLRLWSYLGVVVSASAFLYGLYILVRRLLLGADVPGYASLMTALLFFAGLQLVSLGIIGEYIGRIFVEAKQRPPYVLRRVYDAPHALEARRPVAEGH
jgi:glycosyltransferase involved in cell wall biosynthesis